MINENNLMENNELVKETVDAGTELALNVAKDGAMLKRFGKAAGYVAAGAVACKGVELLIDFIKSKSKKRKNKSDSSEVSDEKTEKTESNED